MKDYKPCHFFGFIFLMFTNLVNAQAPSNFKETIEFIKDGQLDIAINYLDQQNPAPNDSLALGYYQLGVYKYVEDQFEASISWFEKALTIRQSYLDQQDERIIKAFYAIGECYHNLGLLDRALPYLKKSLTLNETRQNPSIKYLSRTYRVMGNVYFKKGEIEQGKEYLNTAIQYYNQYFKKEPWALASVYQDFSVMYVQQELPDSILVFANKGLALFKSLDKQYQEDSLGIADCHHNLGTAYELNNNLEKALFHLSASMKINQKYQEIRLKEIAKNLVNLFIVYQKSGESIKALNTINEAINIYQKLKTPINVARGFHNRGTLFLADGKIKEAILDQQRAIQALVLDYSNNDIYDNPSIEDAIIVDKPYLIKYFHEKALGFSLLATTEEPEKNLKGAISTFDTLAALISNMRKGFQVDGSKEFLASQTKFIFEDAIKAALQLHRITNSSDYLEKAFHYAESSKALILLEAVAKNQRRQEAKKSNTISSKDIELQLKIAKLERSIFDGVTSRSLETDTLLVLRTKLLSLRRDLEKSGKSTTSKKALIENINSIRTLLSGETSLLNYLVGKQSIYLFHLTKKDLNVFSIPLDFNLNSWINKFQEGIYQPFIEEQITQKKREALYQQYSEYAWLLYEKLFPTQLQKQLNQNLVIVPDGTLGYISFGAMLNQPSSERFTGFNNHSFLLKKHSISYSYSASLLVKMAHNTSTPEQPIAIFAPAYHANMIPFGKDSIRFSPLLQSKTSSTAINALMGGELFAGASLAQFVNKSPSYNLIHIAAHAEVDNLRPENSFIAFSDNTPTIQPLLFLDEIYHLGLNADMVAVTACKTSLGPIAEGEGILSLSRAFAYAGAKSIITTLWEINDQKTAMLMPLFYEKLENGENKSQALRKAQLQLMHDYQEPYYWAGFVAYGNMSPVQNNSNFTYWWALIAALILVGAWYYFKK